MDLLRIIKHGLCLTIIPFIVGGCFLIPDLGNLPSPRPDLINSKKAANDNDFPSNGWWTAYKDPQLNNLIQEGLRSSPSLVQAEARLKLAQAVAGKAGASLSPILNSDVFYSRSRQSYNMGLDPAFSPHGFNNKAGAQLNLNYDFDFWGKNSANLAASFSDVEAARIQSEESKLILTTSIAAAYADLAQYYDELDIAKKSVVIREQTVKLFRQRFQKGLENQAGVEQAKAYLANAEAEVDAIMELIKLTKNRLAALLGATPAGSALIKRPHHGAIRNQQLPDLLPADLLGRRPDIEVLRLKAEAAAKRIDVARAGFYPSFNLIGVIGQESLSLENFMYSSSFMAGIGPAIHLPIFEGSKLQSQYRGARANYAEAVAAYNQGIIAALHEVADALTSQRALARQIQKRQEAFNAAEKALKIASNRYQGGLATYIEVLSAQDTMLQARRNLSIIQARLFVVNIALIKALGGGFNTHMIKH